MISGDKCEVIARDAYDVGVREGIWIGTGTTALCFTIGIVCLVLGLRSSLRRGIERAFP